MGNIISNLPSNLNQYQNSITQPLLMTPSSGLMPNSSNASLQQNFRPNNQNEFHTTVNNPNIFSSPEHLRLSNINLNQNQPLMPSANNIDNSRNVDNKMIFNHNDNNQILNMLNVIVNAIQSVIVNDSQTNMLNVIQKVDNDV